MNIVVIGCGRMGATLAYSLFQQGHKVSVVDLSSAAFANLPPDFRGRTIEGEVLNQGTLHRAGIEQADALAAVTSSDALNVVICHIARSVFNVDKVVARNYDPRWWPLHEAFGMQTVSSAAWGADRIREIFTGPAMRSVLTAGHGEIEIYECAIPQLWADKPIGELLPTGVLPVALTRAGKAVLPTPETIVKIGDMLHVSGAYEPISNLRQRLAPTQES